MLLYFPLGFCLGLAAESRLAALGRVLPLVLLISAPLQYAQGWVEGRHPAPADVAPALAGGMAGVMAARKSLSQSRSLV